MGQILGWRAATSHHYDSVAALVATMPTLPANQEGSVLRFSNGLRLKVKGDEYKRIHALISRCTPLAMWEAMRAGTDLEALRRDLPEEFWADFDAIRETLADRLTEVLGQVEYLADGISHLSDKEVGLALRTFPKILQGLIFPYRNGTLDSPRVRDVLFRIVRPTGNKLPNYTPSYAINRAMDEAA